MPYNLDDDIFIPICQCQYQYIWWNIKNYLGINDTKENIQNAAGDDICKKDLLLSAGNGRILAEQGNGWFRPLSSDFSPSLLLQFIQ